MAVTDKALVASSEFDGTAFVQGIDQMTGALERLAAQEDAVRADLKNLDTALKSNRAELKATQDQMAGLDRASKTYTEDMAKLSAQQNTLKAQQKELNAGMKANRDELGKINVAANNYKNSLQGIGDVAKKVAQENKGRTLFDTAGINQQVQQVTEAGSKIRNIFKGKIDTAELDRLEQAIADSSNEFEELGQVVDFVKSKMDLLDPNTEEFAELSRIVQEGEAVLDQFGKTTENVDKKGGSLRARLAAMRTELVKLEDQGKENTKEFQDLQIAAGQLQDAIGDAQARIKVLSSDTKNLDFGIGAVRGLASAYGVAEGAMALFGIKNEDVAESVQRLSAIMLVLNGLQEIQNLLQKQSVVSIVGQEIATKGAAVAQRVYAVAVGTSTGAMKAFRVALLASGIGAFIVLLGLAVDAMDLFGTSTEDATDQNKLYNESLQESMDLLETRTRIIQDTAEIEEEQNKRRNLSEAQLSEERIKNWQREQEAIKLALAGIRASQEAFIGSGQSGDFIEKSNQEATQLFNRIMDIDQRIRLEKEKNLNKTVEDNKKALEKQRQLYEAYLERLTALQRELRDKMLAAQPQDEAAIRQTFRNSLSDALADVDKDVKDKKLTKGRGEMLKNLIRQINEVDLGEALKEFRASAEEAQRELEASLYDIRVRNGQERAELMRDQFEREATAIRVESRNQSTLLKRERDEILRGIAQTRDQGLISPETAELNAEKIRIVYDQLLNNLAQQTTRKNEELAARMFQATQQELQRVFSGVQLFVSQAATVEIQKVTDLYLAGKISYEKYQKELTRITEQESSRRINTALREAQAQLQAVRERMPAEQDPERLRGLQDEERELLARISDLERQLAGADAQEAKRAQDAIAARIQELANYAQAVGGIINQVVGFWSAANQAEQESLNRSIALQEKRVEAATRIAERGNAEYLRLEEDRLNELRVQQENAARRQLAINAVLQTSQALTAFVSALAQGISTGGPLGGLAVATAVIGAIAAGYSIIQSLQAETPQGFFRGTKNVERRGNPEGVDTVPAMLTAGEAVIPRDTNREYAPAVAAIYDRAVPAEELNNFVNSYRVNSRVLPRISGEKIGEAAKSSTSYEAKLLAVAQSQADRMAEQSDILRQVDRRLAGLGISVNMDRDGLAISLMKATTQAQKDKKA